MADIDKVLFDEHADVRRLFTAFFVGSFTGTLAMARTICDQLWVHSTIEEEILYPALRDAIDAKQADQGEEDHEAIADMMAQIAELDDDNDPQVRHLVALLRITVESHMKWEEKVVFPELNSRLSDELLDMGREAFARRQQLLRELPEVPAGVRPGLANTGWGGHKSPAGIHNHGW